MAEAKSKAEQTAEQAPAPVQKPVIKRSVQVNPGRMKLAEVERQDWVCNAEFGTTLEDVQDPAYWAHVARQLKPYDHIEVRVDDGSWIAQFLVLEGARNWARVKLLQKFVLDTADIAQTITSRFEVVWKGPQLKYCVVRLTDSALLIKELGSRTEAQKWLTNYETTVAPV